MQRLIKRHHLILILIVGLVCCVLILNQHLMPSGDNSTYLVLAQSLATGQGYRMISDPRSPQMGLYPPGYPLLLAGVMALTGTTNNPMLAILPSKAMSILLYLAAIVVTYKLLLPRSRLLAALAALLTAVSPAILHFATEVGTEIPYLLLTLACLWAFDRYLRRPGWRELALTALFLLLAFYVRSVALAIAGAFALHLAIRRRYAHAALLVFFVGALTLPWFLRGASLSDTGTSVGLGRGYFDLYLTSDPYGTAPASLADWSARLFQNLQSYVLDIWPSVLFPHASTLRSTLSGLGTVVALLLSLLLALGYALELRRNSPTEWYVGLFFLSCVTYMWAQSRLIVPIVPFALYYLLAAARFVLGRLVFRPAPARPVSDPARPSARGRAVSFALLLFCAVLITSALVVEARRVQDNLQYGMNQPLAVYYSDNAEWGNYLQAMEWVKANAEDQSIVMCRKADLMYIVTAHRALEYPYSYDGLELRRSVEDNAVAYLIEDAFTWTGTTAQYLRPALQSWQSAEPEALSLVFETDAPTTRVWRVEKLD
jgi:hypothetical protein